MCSHEPTRWATPMNCQEKSEQEREAAVRRGVTRVLISGFHLGARVSEGTLFLASVREPTGKLAFFGSSSFDTHCFRYPEERLEPGG